MKGFDERAFKKAVLRAFYGFVYPRSENAVIYAFGKYCELKGVHFDELTVRTQYPDAVATKNGKILDIEFETTSKGFERDKHDPKRCDLVVCWNHDWDECPIDVLALNEFSIFSRQTDSKVAEFFR